MKNPIYEMIKKIVSEVIEHGEIEGTVNEDGKFQASIKFKKKI